MLYLDLMQKMAYITNGGGMCASAFFRDYKEHAVSWLKVYKIHSKGFTVNDWKFLGLNRENYKAFLSNAAYYGMHPINGAYSKWIDDKLTLKYLCAGTKLDEYMPEYYFQIDGSGNILPLMDCPYSNISNGTEAIIDLLKKKGTLAIKLLSGSLGEGFYKGEYIGESYYLNGKVITFDDFCQTLNSLRNYLIIEYLRPNSFLAEFCPNTCNTIRYLLGRKGNEKMNLLKSFIRFGTEASGFVENYNAGGVLCYIDQNGCFCEGNMIDKTNMKNIKLNLHPDSKKALKGKIPFWNKIIEAGEEFDKYFPQMKYLGIDFVVTEDNKVKILEINSLTSLDSIQLNGSILDSDSAREFYEQYLC